MYPLCVYPLRFRFVLVVHTRKAVRATMLDDQMAVKTYLLAVEQFRQYPSSRRITSEEVSKWVGKVLAQHDIGDEDVIGTVTDARADVRCLVGGIEPWEECLAHLLNSATMDGTGMSEVMEGSKNPLCRELLELVEKTVEHKETVEYWDKICSNEV